MAVWFSSEPQLKTSNEEELLVFGYSCKLFRDDDRASFVDHGKHLIPWMGDESHKIDRYDVRGYLHDLDQYEAKPEDPNVWSNLSEEERHIEERCEEERYLALYKDMSEEDIRHEEEMKRLKAALAEDGNYHEIGFNYDEDIQDPILEQEKEPEDEPFQAPENLQIPQGTLLPETMKLHLIIEKTASFVSQHGNQMEIVIKSKQASNPQFEFLNFDSPLNPYYKNLVSVIRSGKYIPKPTEMQSQSDSEDDDDEHYLHPSLFASQQNATVKIPDLQIFRGNQDDAYSKLVQNLKSKVVPDTSIEGQFGLIGDNPVPTNSSGQPLPPGDEVLYHAFSSAIEVGEFQVAVPPPPPEVQSIVDKMAEYVARTGDDFEIVVKRKNDQRFSFLLSDNQHNAYYIYKKQFYRDEKRREALEVFRKEAEERERIAKAKRDALHSYAPNESAGPVSFSLKPKESDPKKFVSGVDLEGQEEFASSASQDSSTQSFSPSLSQELNKPEAETLKLSSEEKLRDRLASAARDKMAQQTRERLLQQQRRLKASLFLNMIKKKNMTLSY